jgi:hypothetical protein
MICEPLAQQAVTDSGMIANVGEKREEEPHHRVSLPGIIEYIPVRLERDPTEGGVPRHPGNRL